VQELPSPSERLEPRRREYEEIVILGVTRITELVGNVAWGHESIAGLENKNLLSDDNLQFPGQNIVPFILTRMGMTRHTYPRCETHLQEAVFSSGICAR
jgi:hypothetical protein